MRLISKLFTDHPEAVNESYLEHMAFAFTFSARLFKAAFAAAAHGIVPAACETTASSTVLAMHEEICARRALMASSSKSEVTLHGAALPRPRA